MQDAGRVTRGYDGVKPGLRARRPGAGAPEPRCLLTIRLVPPAAGPELQVPDRLAQPQRRGSGAPVPDVRPYFLDSCKNQPGSTHLEMVPQRGAGVAAAEAVGAQRDIGRR